MVVRMASRRDARVGGRLVAYSGLHPMTNKRFNIAVYGVGAMLVIGGIFLAFWLAPGPCVRNSESHVTGGKISSVGGLFASETAYYLRYTGNEEGTENDCTFLRRVTAAEYDRQMSGKE
jgi:hypothetical protein